MTGFVQLVCDNPVTTVLLNLVVGIGFGLWVRVFANRIQARDEALANLVVQLHAEMGAIRLRQRDDEQSRADLQALAGVYRRAVHAVAGRRRARMQRAWERYEQEIQREYEAQPGNLGYRNYLNAHARLQGLVDVIKGT